MAEDGNLAPTGALRRLLFDCGGTVVDFAAGTGGGLRGGLPAQGVELAMSQIRDSWALRR